MPPRRPESPSAAERGRQASRASLPSVLFDRIQDRGVPRETAAPDFFVDLNLNQVVGAITAGWAEYDLKPFFHSPLHRIETILYRHEVFRDLEDPKLLCHIRRFAKGMRDVRVHSTLSSRLYDRLHKEMWFVHALEIYCAAVEQFVADLAGARLRSRGLLMFREYLSQYAASPCFATLRDEAKSITSELSCARRSMATRVSG